MVVQSARPNLPTWASPRMALSSRGSSFVTMGISRIGTRLAAFVLHRLPSSFLTTLGEKAVKNNNSSFIVNAKIPAAAAMNGIRQTAIIGFMSLLGVDSFTHQYNKGICLASFCSNAEELEAFLDPLAEVTERVFQNQMAEKLTDINSSNGLHAQFDEQYSRSQRYNSLGYLLHFSQIRFTYGAAPFATCTVMDDKGEILNLSHVDDRVLEASPLLTKSGTKTKSKGKVAHHESFVYLRDKLTVCITVPVVFLSSSLIPLGTVIEPYL